MKTVTAMTALFMMALVILTGPTSADTFCSNTPKLMEKPERRIVMT